MQAKHYLKSVAKAVLAPVIKSLGGYSPALGAGAQMTFGRIFNISMPGMTAYGNKIFYAAQNLLVAKLIETPITFNKKKVDNPTRKLNSFYAQSPTNEQRKAVKETTLQELEIHPIVELFELCNDYSSPLEVWEDFWHNVGFGDGYIWFETFGDLSRDKRPFAIHSLNRNRVFAVPSFTEQDGISHYTFSMRNGRTIRIEKQQMLHLKKWNPNSGSLIGFNPADVVAPLLSLDDENVFAQGNAFVNGGRGTLFSSDITLDNDGEVIEKMDAEQMDILKETIQNDFQGSKNYRKMHWTNGYVNVQNYGDTLAEMELSKTSVQYWEYIYASLGIPDVLCPTTKASTESNVQAGYKALVTNTIIPQLRLFDQKLTRTIQQWWPGVICVHDLTEFNELAPDLKLMMEVYGKPRIRVDEQRKIFGYGEIGGEIGESILVESGLVKIEDVVMADDDEEVQDDQL